MRMRQIKHLGIVISLFVQLVAGAPISAEDKHRYIPEKGFVPDVVTAVKIAEAVLIPIYGEEQIASERPFTASLRGDKWIVKGTLHGGGFGGVALAEISKKDGRVLRVSHGK